MNQRNSNETWRVFCAIEIPELTRGRVLQHIARLRETVPDARASWSRDANLHLTLKFLGEIPQTSVPNVSAAASRAVVELRPFVIRLEHTGAFPKHGQPRVLWIGIDDPSACLSELQTRLENECAKEGFEKEKRLFHPHLTLARLRQPQHANELSVAHKQQEFEPADIEVRELLVIRSELSSKGSKYTVISRHPLGVSDKL